MAVIPLTTPGHHYEVRIGTGLLAELVDNCRGLLRKRGVPVVTDANVHGLWGEVVEKSLRDSGHEPYWCILPPGEASKSWEHLASTVDWMLAHACAGSHRIPSGRG